MYFFLARAFARDKKKYIAPFGATYLTYVRTDHLTNLSTKNAFKTYGRKPTLTVLYICNK